VVGIPKAKARPAPNSYLQAVTVAMASGQVGFAEAAVAFKLIQL